MIVKCPTCHGFPFAIASGNQHFQDWPCQMCLGSGKVDNEHVCYCGRPAIRQVGDTLICSSDECVDKVLGKTEQKPVLNVYNEWWGESYYVGD